jgi:ATP synthase protein I
VAESGNEHDGDGRSPAHQERKGREVESRIHDDGILRARLGRLSDALAAQNRDERQASAGGQGQQGADSRALGNVMSLAFRVLSEFVAAVIVGTAIGLGIDRLAGTSPLFLIVFLLLGAAAGFWNVYRIGTEKPGRDNK